MGCHNTIGIPINIIIISSHNITNIITSKPKDSFRLLESRAVRATAQTSLWSNPFPRFYGDSVVVLLGNRWEIIGNILNLYFCGGFLLGEWECHV